MGGNGAKERRKLQRQQKLQEQQAVVTTESADTEFKSKSVARDVAPAATHKDNQDSNRKASRNPKIAIRNKYPRAVGKPVKKDKKFKKPKHLKRKLELAADDEVVREKIQAELETFIKTKKQRHNQKTQHIADANKKVEIDPSMHVQCYGQEEKEQKFKEVEEAEEKSFPRSGSRIANTIAVSSFENDDSAGKVTKNNNSSQIDVENKNDGTQNLTDEDDDDDDDPTDFKEKRTRGRRRRGRQGRNTSDIVKEQQEQDQGGNKLKGKMMNQSKPADEHSESHRGENDSNSRSDEAPTENSDLSRREKNRDRRANKDDGRYCIGRKPCTDFIIGKTYSGKVVYVKPFGIFLDIGCHSDAFCHVSRLSDEYIENPSDHFKEGDTIESIRVVEIDRKNKRLTVSLQSESRIADEQASIDARQKRRERLQGKKKKTNTTDQSRISISHQMHNNFNLENRKRKIESALGQHTSFDGHDEENRETESQFLSNSDSQSPHKMSITASTTTTKLESEMSHSELKRARKLARRAARREAVAAVEAK